MEGRAKFCDRKLTLLGEKLCLRGLGEGVNGRCKGGLARLRRRLLPGGRDFRL